MSVFNGAKDVSPFASNNRTTGSPAEYKAIALGTNAYFGTYSVDEAAKTFTLNIEGATFPNWVGQEQKRAFEIKDDVMTYGSTTGSRGEGSVALVWKKVR